MWTSDSCLKYIKIVNDCWCTSCCLECFCVISDILCCMWNCEESFVYWTCSTSTLCLLECLLCVAGEFHFCLLCFCAFVMLLPWTCFLPKLSHRTVNVVSHSNIFRPNCHISAIPEAALDRTYNLVAIFLGQPMLANCLLIWICNWCASFVWRDAFCWQLDLIISLSTELLTSEEASLSHSLVPVYDIGIVQVTLCAQ